MPVYEKAHAKINLLLAVTAKRADGFHELQTVYQSLALHDTLRLTSLAEDKIVLTCDDPSLPAGPDNLAWRAAERLKRFYRISHGVRIELKKRIPVAAGLAGGSSDAAAVLRGLVRLWHLPWEQENLLQLAVGLGSDVPFCLSGGTALGTGRGEKVTNLAPCPHFYVVLANPGFMLKTAEVYRSLTEADLEPGYDPAPMLRALACGDRNAMGANLTNTLEAAAFRLNPAIRALKEKLARRAPSLMCGSGPTVFALFTVDAEAEKAALSLRSEGYFVWLTETFSRPTAGGE
ncbi:MAG TPA: 4-(cytidine 5'-diphospho)-2-C-methyl-D-erythritol kinase [Firmicutes bacterium]|nr:4-(cytidine 5'-diphospho)-2-C-methyl-D-erythritol kinase [Bacillota bacterium]